MDALRIHATEMIYDLRAAERRLAENPDGYRDMICSGEVNYEDGTRTGVLPGKLARGPQSLPTNRGNLCLLAGACNWIAQSREHL